MINHDAPVDALDTYPNYRHRVEDPSPISASNQSLMRLLCMVHNHPSGDPTPSTADIQMTKQVVDIAKPLGIAVHDHIIIGKRGHVSLKGLQLM